MYTQETDISQSHQFLVPVKSYICRSQITHEDVVIEEAIKSVFTAEMIKTINEIMDGWILSIC